MSAYVIVDIDIHDPEGYAEYRKQADATVAAYGGRYIARGGRTEVFEGSWQPNRLVILEFASVERARAWLDSPEYCAIKPIRHRTSRGNMIAVEGYEWKAP